MKPSDEIRKLAAQHGVTADRVYVDDWTDKMSGLSGQDSGSADEIEQFLINLRRENKIDPAFSQELLLRYLDSERHAGED